MNRNQELLFQAAEAMKAKPGELREKAAAAMAEIKRLHQTIEKFEAEASLGQAQQFLTAAKRWAACGCSLPSVPAWMGMPAADGGLPPGQGAQGGGGAGLHQRGQDHLPGRLRQGAVAQA